MMGSARSRALTPGCTRTPHQPHAHSLVKLPPTRGLGIHGSVETLVAQHAPEVLIVRHGPDVWYHGIAANGRQALHPGPPTSLRPSRGLRALVQMA